MSSNHVNCTHPNTSAAFARCRAAVRARAKEEANAMETHGIQLASAPNPEMAAQFTLRAFSDALDNLVDEATDMADRHQYHTGLAGRAATLREVAQLLLDSRK